MSLLNEAVYVADHHRERPVKPGIVSEAVRSQPLQQSFTVIDREGKVHIVIVECFATPVGGTGVAVDQVEFLRIVNAEPSALVRSLRPLELLKAGDITIEATRCRQVGAGQGDVVQSELQNGLQN